MAVGGCAGRLGAGAAWCAAGAGGWGGNASSAVAALDPPAESEGVGGAMGVAGEARGRRSGGDENENRGKGDGNLLTRRGRRGSRARRDKNRETPLGRVAPRRSDGDGAGSRCREREHSRRAGGVETTRERGGFPTKSARRFCQKIRAGRARGGGRDVRAPDAKPRSGRSRGADTGVTPSRRLLTRPPMGAPPVNGHRGPPNARTAAANVERWRFL